MKLTKILGLAIAIFAFAACSEDDEWSWNGQSGATVSMMQTEISFKENKGIVKVPIKVDGERNGRVQATVAVKTAGENAAVEDQDFFVTSKVININEKDSVGYVEINLVDNDEINEAKAFEITLVSAKSATVGGATSTVVTIKDNDAAFYEKLQGNWIIESGNEKWNGKIVGYDEGEDGYDKVLYLIGYMGYDWTTMQINYFFDPQTKKGHLEIPLGTLFAEDVNFGLGGLNDVYLAAVAGNSLVIEGDVEGEWSDDFNTITFEDCMFTGAIFSGTDFTGYVWFRNQGLKLTRAK